jgi:uncharacterized protein (TIGR02391 family)
MMALNWSIQHFQLKNLYLLLIHCKVKLKKANKKGFSNLLVGLFGAIRNPTAHAPKIFWDMSEQDALDILTFISFMPRKTGYYSKNLIYGKNYRKY